MNDDQRLTWFDARSICVLEGGDLASCHGPGELEYLTDYYQPK